MRHYRDSELDLIYIMTLERAMTLKWCVKKIQDGGDALSDMEEELNIEESWLDIVEAEIKRRKESEVNQDTD